MVSLTPKSLHPTTFIAPGAVVVGDVTFAEETSVWFNAVIRGDTDPLTIGAQTNIQDLCMLHADPGYPVVLGRGVTVGHRVIVHGAQVGDNTLVGMGAILLNGVVVGANCIIGAGALLTQGKHYPDNVLILGSPAKVVREVTPQEVEMNRISAQHYVQKAREYRAAYQAQASSTD